MSDEQKLPQINVKGVAPVDNKVVVFERHADHPEGEAFVVNDGSVYTVAETREVRRAIGEGRLEKTDQAATQRVNWNSRQQQGTLRPSTEQEKDAAGLQEPVERNTAETVNQPFRKGVRP